VKTAQVKAAKHETLVNKMKRQLSKSTPWVVICTIALVFIGWQMVRGSFYPYLRSVWVLLGLIIFAGAFVWQILFRRRVCLDSQYLYIEGRKGMIQVPLRVMKEAHFNQITKIVTITLKLPTEYGKNIEFYPNENLNPPKYSSLIADELNDIINSLEDKADSIKASTHQI